MAITLIFLFHTIINDFTVCNTLEMSIMLFFLVVQLLSEQFEFTVIEKLENVLSSKPWFKKCPFLHNKHHVCYCLY